MAILRKWVERAGGTNPPLKLPKMDGKFEITELPEYRGEEDMAQQEESAVLSNDAIVLLSALHFSNEPMSLDGMLGIVPDKGACLRFMDDAEADGLIDIRIVREPRMYYATPTAFGRTVASSLVLMGDTVASGRPPRERGIATERAFAILLAIKDGTFGDRETSAEVSADLLRALEDGGLIESVPGCGTHPGYRLTPSGEDAAEEFRTAMDRIASRRRGGQSPSCSVGSHGYPAQSAVLLLDEFEILVVP